MNLSQMARNPNVKIFWPADDKGERSALGAALHHRAGAERTEQRKRQKS